jgi:hypothetical protein
VGVGVGVAVGVADSSAAIAIELELAVASGESPERPLAAMTGIPADTAQAARTRARIAVSSRRLGSFGRAPEMAPGMLLGAAITAEIPEPMERRKRPGRLSGPLRSRWAMSRPRCPTLGSGWAMGSAARAAALAGTASLSGPDRSLRLLTSGRVPRRFARI